MFFFSPRICSLYFFRLYARDGDIWDVDRGSYSRALLLLSHSVHLCGRSKDQAQYQSVLHNYWWNIRSETILATTSFHKTFYYTLHAASYGEKHLSFTRRNAEWPGCSGSSARTTTDGPVGSVGAAPSYRIMPRHGRLKNTDLILWLLWNFQSLTSFNCCNATSQSKKSWTFFYSCLQEQGFIIMQNFYIFVIALRPSFPQKTVAFLWVLFLHFAWKEAWLLGHRWVLWGHNTFQLGLACGSHQGGGFHGFKNLKGGETQLIAC